MVFAKASFAERGLQPTGELSFDADRSSKLEWILWRRWLARLGTFSTFSTGVICFGLREIFLGWETLGATCSQQTPRPPKETTQGSSIPKLHQAQREEIQAPCRWLVQSVQAPTIAKADRFRCAVRYLNRELRSIGIPEAGMDTLASNPAAHDSESQPGRGLCC
jgi:hypothetical protein